MARAETDYEALWQALPTPALLVDAEGRVREANGAAEDFLGVSRRVLAGRLLAGQAPGGRALASLAGEDSALAALIARVVASGAALSEYGVELSWPDFRPGPPADALQGVLSGTAPRPVDLVAAPAGDGVLIVIHPRAGAERMGRQAASRDAARSVAGLAATLAHEIRNPLAGISGAAQLLAKSASERDRELTGLIREEAERIGDLVARVERFGDIALARRVAVNIHDVLDRAARSARAGFAAHLQVTEGYDPSLPPTVGDPDQLMQVVLNLLKNAAEAAPPVGGAITIATAWRAGMRVRTGAGSESLPLEISISDNGAGVPEDLMPHIFEPFVTSRAHGTGLGLALVSKVVADHGGVVSCDSAPGRTVFRILLPLADAGAPAAAEGAAENAA